MSSHFDKLRVWRESPATMVRELFNIEPDAWQLEALEMFPKSPRIAMCACKGPGKAQPKNTVIPTPSGEKRFGDLVVGDEIFTQDGSITRVKAIYERGILPINRVSFDDGSFTMACGEHLWRVRGRTERRHDTWSTLTTDQIVARGVREKNGKWAGRHFEIPRQQAIQMPHAKLPVDPYVLGVWIGDGARGTGRYATKTEDEIKPQIEKRGYRTSATKAGAATIYGITTGLRRLNLFDLYSFEKFLPDSYKLASADQRRDLLCGLMDTDGGIGDDGHMEYSTTSKVLADDVVWLVRSLGGVGYVKGTIKQPYYRNPNGKIVQGKPCYRVTVTVPFNPFTLKHKAQRWKDPARSPSTIRYMTRKIDAIEPAGEADCRCIEVEHSSKLYLTNDFIVTHNSTVLAWLSWNFLLTRPHPKVAATSISGDNLADGLWTEMAKWQGKSELLKAMFTWTKTRIFANDHPETWFMSARTWAKTADKQAQGNALAGLHADYILFVVDESGGIPDAVMVAAEAAFAGTIECHIVQAGNPTQLSGPLYRAATSSRDLWKVINITGDPDDPKRSPRIPIEYAREQIKQYGRESPWVLVNIFGKFPPSSLNVLIGPDEVREAMGRYYREYEINAAARVLGVDVAREGDDASVIAKRQGLQVFPLKKYRNITGIQGAGLVAREWQDWQAHACFIDMTGGFGASWFDQLSQLGRGAVPVLFSAAAVQSDRYYNKRTEMYFGLVEWIKRGGALPESPEIVAALTQTEYSFKGDRLILEPKDMIKQKIGYSPDEADAICCTFAAPVSPPTRRSSGARLAAGTYDPFKELAS